MLELNDVCAVGVCVCGSSHVGVRSTNEEPRSLPKPGNGRWNLGANMSWRCPLVGDDIRGGDDVSIPVQLSCRENRDEYTAGLYHPSNSMDIELFVEARR